VLHAHRPRRASAPGNAACSTAACDATGCRGPVDRRLRHGKHDHGPRNVLDHVEGWAMSWARERGRDPQLYDLRVFGDPRGDEPWSWRFGGHHVSVQHVVRAGEHAVLPRRPPGRVPRAVPRACVYAKQATKLGASASLTTPDPDLSRRLCLITLRSTLEIQIRRKQCTTSGLPRIHRAWRVEHAGQRLPGHARTAAADHPLTQASLRHFSLPRSAVAPGRRETGAWLGRPPRQQRNSWTRSGT